MVTTMLFTRKRVSVLTALGCLITLVLLQNVRSLSQKNSGFQRTESRRNVLIQGLQTISMASVVSPKPALALKERNEALCGTGFFTNIAQYMCTDIGDISDEGKSRKISDSEMSSMDSLLGKLGATAESTENDQVQGENEKKASSKD